MMVLVIGNNSVPVRSSPMRAVEGAGGAAATKASTPPEPRTVSQCMTYVRELGRPSSSCPTTLTAGDGTGIAPAAWANPVMLKKLVGNGGEKPLFFAQNHDEYLSTGTGNQPPVAGLQRLCTECGQRLPTEQRHVCRE